MAPVTAVNVYDMVSGADTGGVEEFFTMFAYEGFNPEMVHEHFAVILEKKGIDNDEFVKDMRALITLGAMKGNYTMRNAGKISDAGREKADSLYKKYQLKQGGLGGDKKAIILPRVLSAFPELTTKVILKAPERNFGTNTGFLPKFMKNPVFPSLVPHRLSSACARTLLYLYTVYSAEQSITISQQKDFDDAFTAQSQFVTIAFNSTVPVQSTRVSMCKAQIEDLVDAVSNGKALTMGTPPADRVDAKKMREELNKLSV